MSADFDVIVIGVGSMGSAACFELAQRGLKVLGIEQFNFAHDLGSHTGQSRLIRKSYFESSEYVPLLKRAYQLWDKLESVAKTKLFYQTGITYLGEEDHPMLLGVRNYGAQYRIPVRSYDAPSTKQVAPLFNFNDSIHAVVESEAGFVLPERSILAYCEASIRNGVSFLTQTKVFEWRYHQGVFEVNTSSGHYSAQKLILTSGAWTDELLPDLRPNLRVHQQTLAWFNPVEWDPFLIHNFPCWMYSNHNLDGTFYGFPILPTGDFHGPLGLKIAYHAKGKEVRPDDKSATADLTDLHELQSFVATHLPSAGSMLGANTCLYTYSPDEDFYIDHLPNHEGAAAIACGFSGHGFKFSPVVGEILCDLVTTGHSDLPIDFLKLDR